MLKKYVWCGLVVLITGTAFALGTGGEENLRRKAKAGDAEAQYLLAMQLEMTTDPVNLKESEFYYWLKKAAENGEGAAQDLLDDIEAEYDKTALEDELAPNGSQKLMNEVFKLENQKQKNYPLIKEKLDLLRKYPEDLQFPNEIRKPNPKKRQGIQTAHRCNARPFS